MKKTFINKNGVETLHLGEVTVSMTLPSFDAFVMAIQGMRGSPDTPKMAHAGFIPARFRYHTDPRKPVKGVKMWRTALGEVDRISCLVCDVDNDKPRSKTSWQDVQGTGLTVFGYDSFSGTPTNPRFRAIFETDRCMDRAEVRKVMAWINKHVFNQQLDMSMADRAHYAIVPDHRATEYFSFGEVLCVDDVLGLVDEEIAAGCPYLSVGAFSRSAKATQSPLYAKRGQTIVNQALLNNRSISNPDVTSWVADDDIAEYIESRLGHWQTMFIVLHRAYRRSGHVLTYGDLEHIARYLDKFASDYFFGKYTDEQLSRRITDAMSVEKSKSIFRKQKR